MNEQILKDIIELAKIRATGVLLTSTLVNYEAYAELKKSIEIQLHRLEKELVIDLNLEAA